MNTTQTVLGLHPTVAGMGWVLATSPLSLVDWGIVYPGSNKNAKALRRAEYLIKTFSPSVIVMRHAAGTSRKRVKRIQSLMNSVKHLAKRNGIEFKVYSAGDVKGRFERFGVATRHEIAAFLAANIPELASRLPPKRKPWLPEDTRLGLFDAMAIVIAFFIERDLLDNPFPPKSK